MGRTSDRLFREAIRENFGCDASFVEAVPVTQRFRNELIWEGLVHVYELKSHPTAERCYAWAEMFAAFWPNQRVYTVLGTDVIDTPLKAVQANLVERYKGSNMHRGRTTAAPQVRTPWPPVSRISLQE